MTHKTVTLEAPSASGRKFYTIDINTADSGATYTVDFRYGAVGGSVNASTKTKAPVTLEAAEKIFHALVKEKMTGSSHYRVAADASAPVVLPAEVNLSACRPPRLLNDVNPDFVLQLVSEDAWWVQIKHDGVSGASRLQRTSHRRAARCLQPAPAPVQVGH